ncbi:zf-UBR-domain-containing protein [Hortaea werneckii]|uniref:UBR-type domain-containing protein n=1 Tax=Hortaea werneckii TaxID=91943 RepID=A0A3M7BX57_HORWE|nr:zf-UBR-domain-containing protein [Hortaea werneckii]KAI7566439.1 zf-UBR-domain-containing protein [Hortaea werneckii]KAI7598316.1 zf-UBR-domain-containing protein [Hortaea werneckii]KAI7615483.1 zf-UBR-domain-containing protein [Hortaea werneckii]KAI7699333.1 zf-UBR-domain-containing protein [Hortaea werneckii]
MEDQSNTVGLPKRTNSMSQASETSHTAQDYIASQLRLEADAREALPYQFDTCTRPLGPLRQSVFACLTCTPPPASRYQQFTPAGLCYSCSISCHGEHNLVELFTKRDFECDCGTTRLSSSGTPCSLRQNPSTGNKGGITNEEPRKDNRYNQNYEGRFCGCGDEYDPEKEKGTMFQCLGLGTVEEGGCGEDWWHPECLMGLPRNQTGSNAPGKAEVNGGLETLKEEQETNNEHQGANGATEEPQVEDPPLPSGFPDEDAFDHLICYKCVNAFPWIKQYAGTPGFLPAVPAKPTSDTSNAAKAEDELATISSEQPESKKRKAEDEAEHSADSLKKAKPEPESKDEPSTTVNPTTSHDATAPLHTTLPPAPSGPINLFLTEDFRNHFCRCSACFPQLAKHKQLLEEEDSYEPPMSESDAAEDGNASLADRRSVGSGSLLERGEAALSSMDRVRAIEGVMAYNHVRDKVKAFLQPFAESGQAVSAEEVKAYFAKLRGDETEQGQSGTGTGGSGAEEDHRREQGGY